MSNELTPQEKHPKFYKDPHLWIGAIEVECVKFFMRPVGMGVSGYNEGEIIKLTPQTYDWLKTPRIIECVTPLFKPQEGEQFIKDLEQAISAATVRKNVKHCSYDAVSELFNVNEGEFFVEVFDKTFAICVPYKAYFDAATFVDTLRKLGYYL
jgi:hypothetical protein